MRTVAIIQARLGSTRLPGKVLSDIAGRSMIARVIERADRIHGIGEVVVAIPDLAADDRLANAVTRLDRRVVRGPADDVLARYVLAMERAGAEAIVRITADCPVLSPSISSAVVAAFVSDPVDYASNTLKRTYPRGLDTEVFRAESLRQAADEATTPAEREHVTPFIWRRPERFRLRSVQAGIDRSSMRWTVDTEEDLALIRTIYAELGKDDFDTDEILALIAMRPDLAAINAGIAQKGIFS